MNASSSHLDQWNWDATIQPNSNAYAVPNRVFGHSAVDHLTVIASIAQAVTKVDADGEVLAGGLRGCSLRPHG